jgi:hypothetical protein
LAAWQVEMPPGDLEVLLGQLLSQVELQEMNDLADRCALRPDGSWDFSDLSDQELNLDSPGGSTR